MGGWGCLETNLASRWEGVRLPRASEKSPDFPGSSPNFPGSFSTTSPEVLSLWNLTAIQRFPGSFPNFPGSSPNFPEIQPLSLGSLTPSPDSQKLSLRPCGGPPKDSWTRPPSGGSRRAPGVRRRSGFRKGCRHNSCFLSQSFVQ